MRFLLFNIFIFGLFLGLASSAWIQQGYDDIPDIIESPQSRNHYDQVSPRSHGLLALSHHHHHAHHALGHHALHHPILTKKLLLLKFTKLGHLAHHHHHHGHHHGHHLLHHLLHHHHHLRSHQNTPSDTVLEVIPVSDPTGAFSGISGSIGSPNLGSSLVNESPTVQAYSVPSEYLQVISDTPTESDYDNYEEPIEDVPEYIPGNKHLISSDGLDQSPIYLYAVPQQVELGRSAVRNIKNRKKFKN